MDNKYIYIHKILGYVEYNTPISNENNSLIGDTWEDYLHYKYILLSPEQMQFKENHPNASVEEVFNMSVPERTLQKAKDEMISRIEEYDKSSAVNEFIVNGTIRDWFTPEQRSDYRNSIDAAKLMNIENLSLYVGDSSITISTSLAEQLLAQIQLYANSCFMVKKQHIQAVEALGTIEEVDAFDYTQDYPNKLEFTL